MIALMCRDVVERLDDILDNTAPAEVRHAAAVHLKACPRCVEFVRAYGETPSIVRRVLTAQTPSNLAVRVREFLRREAARERDS